MQRCRLIGGTQRPLRVGIVHEQAQEQKDTGRHLFHPVRDAIPRGCVSRCIDGWPTTILLSSSSSSVTCGGRSVILYVYNSTISTHSTPVIHWTVVVVVVVFRSSAAVEEENVFSRKDIIHIFVCLVFAQSQRRILSRDGEEGGRVWGVV